MKYVSQVVRRQMIYYSHSQIYPTRVQHNACSEPYAIDFLLAVRTALILAHEQIADEKWHGSQYLYPAAKLAQ